jgi:hypothetical protein
MTRLFFAGAEQPSHRNLLSDCGVTRFAINLTNINRAVSGAWNVAEHLPPDAEWVAYADEHTTWEMAAPFVAQGPTLTLGPLEWAEHFEDDTEFAPFYQAGLQDWTYPVVALTDDNVKHQSALRTILSQFSHNTLIAVTGSSRGVERLDALVTSAWIASQKYGETQVWGGTKLHRYAGSRKAEARPRHRADIERLGIDYKLIEVDDPEETARLAVVSWLAWEERHAVTAPNLVALSSTEEYSDQDGMGSAHVGLASVSRAARHDREQILLPVMGLEAHEERQVDGNGEETFRVTESVSGVGQLMRSCDSCFIATKCPAFQPQHTCAFKIPVVIKSKDQLQGLMRTVIEIQGQRVLFARFAEEIEGQGLDGSLSSEIDRLFKSLAAMKEINDTRDVLRLEMEARGNSGMLSRLFGADIGNTAKALQAPLHSDQVLDAFERSPDH